jgi:hypothetical protein
MSKKPYVIRQFDSRSGRYDYWLRGPLTLMHYTSSKNDATRLRFSEARTMRDRLDAMNAAYPLAPKHELELA